ncbi:MAG: type II secretion system protein [Firmicutes bacterium]|nr:type II secretion system protein [Bacillota bacterium]
MNQKKGFTLVELLGVIVILGIIALISLPPILNQLNDSKDTINSTTLKLIYSAGEVYLDERQNDYKRTPDNIFCVTISEIAADNKLNLPVKDASSGKEIDPGKYVKFTVNNHGGLNYEEQLYDSCTPVVN